MTDDHAQQARKPGWLQAAPLIFLTFWSGGFVFAKMGIAHADPLTFLALRFAIVAAAMVAVWAVLRTPLPKDRKGWIHLATIGILMQTVYFGFTYIAFATDTAAGIVALILSLQPVLAGIVSPALTGEKVGWRGWAGLAMGLIGTALVIIARMEIATPPPMGLAVTVIALFALLAATLMEKRHGHSYHPVTASMIQFAAGFIAIVPFALLLEEGRLDWHPELGIALAYLVICNSLIATSLLLAMIRAGAVARVSALFFLVPPVAAVMAWALLGEVMPPLAWPGLALAGAGVLLATRR